MLETAVALFLALPPPAQSPTGAGPAVSIPSRQTALIELRSVRLAPVTVEFVEAPWGPKTMDQIESADANWLSKRQWAFARLQLSTAARAGKTLLAAGNYALILRRAAPPVGPGLEVEFRRTADADFLMPGVPVSRLPAGETVLLMPVTLARDAVVVPKLGVTLSQERGAVRLVTAYGDRRFTAELRPR